MQTIRNPIELLVDVVKQVGDALVRVAYAVRGNRPVAESVRPEVRRIALADLRAVLRKGLEDFRAARTDVAFICIIYPIVGLLLVRGAFHYAVLPLIFPAIAGFALVGPVAGIGLYELSRQRERGERPNWLQAVAMVSSPAFGAILLLGLVLAGLFFSWLGAAQAVYDATLGPAPPASLAAFVQDVLTTPAGWTMIVVGTGIGFLFALVAFVISVVSFPMMLDRDAGVVTAVTTSVRVVAKNPGPMTAWAAILVAGLGVGAATLFLGLIVVMPVLGHATWHLYRLAVARPGEAGASV